MAGDFFLIDAPQAVPGEFATWAAAKQNHEDLFLAYLDAELGSATANDLERAALEAKFTSNRLERVAREAWQSCRRLPE